MVVASGLVGSAFAPLKCRGNITGVRKDIPPNLFFLIHLYLPKIHLYAHAYDLCRVIDLDGLGS